MSKDDAHKQRSLQIFGCKLLFGWTGTPSHKRRSASRDEFRGQTTKIYTNLYKQNKFMHWRIELKT